VGQKRRTGGGSEKMCSKMGVRRETVDRNVRLDLRLFLEDSTSGSSFVG
jgi:hypothetical protein